MEHTKQALDFLLVTGGAASIAYAIRAVSDTIFKWVALESLIKGVREFSEDEEFFRSVEQRNLPVSTTAHPDTITTARSM